MGKKVSKKSSCIIQWNSPQSKESIFEECDEQSPISTLDLSCPVKKQQLDEPQQPIPPAPLKQKQAKGKKIHKERHETQESGRKKKIHNPQNRFQREHRRRFYLFPFLFATSFPFCKISWEYWKPTRYFTRMAEFLSSIQGLPGKTSDQCKSFDERQKKEIYSDLELLEAAFTEIKESEPDEFSLSILQKYVQCMEEKSEYMQFLIKHDPEGEGMAGDRGMSKQEEEYRQQTLGDSIINEYFDTTTRAGVF